MHQYKHQKTMDLTIHDGRLRDDKNYTLTVQIGEEASEGGAAPDVVTYLSQKASGYQIKTGKVSWYTPLSGEIPVSVQVQEEGENTNSFTVTGSLSMKSEKETNLSLTIGEWFLGCLILLYLIFPLLRFFMIKSEKFFFIIATGIYLIVLFHYDSKSTYN